MTLYLVERLNTWDNPLYQFDGVYSQRDLAMKSMDKGEVYRLSTVVVDSEDQNGENEEFIGR